MQFDELNSHARSTDPDTSHEAAASINITDQAKVILKSYWPGLPLLDIDAYSMAGFPPHARDGQRCSDLRHKGLITRIGRKAKTPSGRYGHLCAITDIGREYLESGRV